MTIALCLIGNSHVVALRDALAARPDRWPGLAPRFHGFRNIGPDEVGLRGRRLWPETARALDQMRRVAGGGSLDLAPFGAFVVVGLNLKVELALWLRREAVWPDLPSVVAAADLAAGPTLLSGAAARAAYQGKLLAGTALLLAGRLADLGRPVLVVGAPRPHPVLRARGAGAALGLAAASPSASRAAARHIGARFLPQPAHTRRRALFTAPPYLAEPGPEARDLKHANAAYGALVLDQVAEALAA